VKQSTTKTKSKTPNIHKTKRFHLARKRRTTILKTIPVNPIELWTVQNKIKLNLSERPKNWNRLRIIWENVRKDSLSMHNNAGEMKRNHKNPFMVQHLTESIETHRIKKSYYSITENPKELGNHERFHCRKFQNRYKLSEQDSFRRWNKKPQKILKDPREKIRRIVLVNVDEWIGRRREARKQRNKDERTDNGWVDGINRWMDTW